MEREWRAELVRARGSQRAVGRRIGAAARAMKKLLKSAFSASGAHVARAANNRTLKCKACE
eukprot:4978181-Pyramimonas_sp.AAC.1